MKYKYTSDNGWFIPGLPARDLDDAELTDEQLEMLKLGVQLEIYTPEAENEKISGKKEKKNAVKSLPSDSG